VTVSRNPKPNGGVIHSENFGEDQGQNLNLLVCGSMAMVKTVGELWTADVAGNLGKGGPEVAEAIFASTPCSGCGVLLIGH
jgi:hypothetical protein